MYHIVCRARSLERRVNLLDPVVLEVVSSKVTQLIADLEALNKAQSKGKAGKAGKSSGSGSSAATVMSDDQLGDVANKVAALDGFAGDLPSLLLRLKTLATVHEEVSSVVCFTASVHTLSLCTEWLVGWLHVCTCALLAH
jgi:hypothetical protein